MNLQRIFILKLLDKIPEHKTEKIANCKFKRMFKKDEVNLLKGLATFRDSDTLQIPFLSTLS